MNWFERYSIIGGYFLSLLFFWVISLSNLSLQGDQLKYYGAIFVGIFLLAGYLVAIASQWIYYVLPLPFLFLREEHMHKKVLNEIERHLSSQKQVLNGNISNMTEAIAEIKLTADIWKRVTSSSTKDGVEALKKYASFFTKRWDIIAINRSIILATYVSPIIAIILIVFLKDVSFDLNILAIYGICLLSSFVIFVLHQSGKTVSGQICLGLRMMYGINE